MGVYLNTKTFPNIRCIYRQWQSKRAEDHRLKPYSLTIKVVLECHSLDEEDLRVLWSDSDIEKDFTLWLGNTFVNKVIVANDDPALRSFQNMANDEKMDVSVLPNVGTERIAEIVFNWWKENLITHDLISRVDIRTADITEDEHNSVYYIG